MVILLSSINGWDWYDNCQILPGFYNLSSESQSPTHAPMLRRCLSLKLGEKSFPRPVIGQLWTFPTFSLVKSYSLLISAKVPSRTNKTSRGVGCSRIIPGLWLVIWHDAQSHDWMQAAVPTSNKTTQLGKFTEMFYFISVKFCRFAQILQVTTGHWHSRVGRKYLKIKFDTL